MGKDPAVLLYTSDFLTGTEFFTWEEKGIYIHLLCLQHQNGAIPHEYMCRLGVDTHANVLAKFEKDENGSYLNKRMYEEAEKRRKYSESRRNNVKKRYEKKKDDSTHVVHMNPHMENENENENRVVNDNIKPCPHTEIINLYHEILPELPNISTLVKDGKESYNWKGARATHLKSRWCESERRQSLDWWKQYFEFVKSCDFLMGKKAGTGGRAFKASLAWLVNPANFEKVTEKNYVNS